MITLRRAPIRPAAASTAALLLGCAGVLYACNVPVFRYALERWNPDAYRVLVLHRGPLSDEQRAQIKPLEEPAGSRANVALRTLDVNELDEATYGQFVASQKDPTLPWLVVQYPAHLRIDIPLWQGPLDENVVARLTGSKIRQELVRRLAEGQTAVWLLLETGRAEVDEEVAARIEGELKKLQQELKLPELTDAPEDGLLTSSPLRIEFSLLRVPRGDADQALVEMLIRSESDLAERSDPMVFPVFGRGRALYPLVGAGITGENIHDAAAFLAGPCSCQVKELNPGFDLLLAAEWDTLLAPDGVSLAALTPSPSLPPADPVLVPIPGGSPAPVAASAASATAPRATAARPAPALNKSVLLAGALLTSVLVIVGVFAWIHSVRPSPPAKRD